MRQVAELEKNYFSKKPVLVNKINRETKEPKLFKDFVFAPVSLHLLYKKKYGVCCVCAKTRYLWFRGFGLSQVVDIKKTIGVSKLKTEGKPKPDSGNFFVSR
jgi:hypothetical protein